MTDVHEAIERVGARFDPPDGGFDDLSRRRNRARARRRIAVGALALTVAGGGSLLAARAFPASTPGPLSKIRVLATWPATSHPTAAAASAPTCPTPSGDSPPPVVLSSTSGAAGSSIEVTGMFPSEELWMQLWWNAGEIAGDIAPPPWPPTGPDLQFAPAGPGPVVKLAAIAGPATTGKCSFQMKFTVPEFEPGSYQVQWVFGGEAHATQPRGEGGFYLLTSLLTFQVTG
ncbi:MAG TPA: hypothetical protein VEQ37_18495 [Actinomycetota bacterium]|nr:hypothetical protein [Actinomycetota bacterium]